MKKLNRSILRRINYLIGIILSAIGISSCEFRCEYGSPSAEFQVSGRVINAQSGMAIKNIKVTLKSTNNYNYDYPENHLFPSDTTSTNGAFFIGDGGPGFGKKEYCLIAEDIDSTENGVYKTDSILLSPEYQNAPNNNWHYIANMNEIILSLEEEKDNNE